jgi:hypothetical protein
VNVSMSGKGVSYDEGEVPSYWSYRSLQHFVPPAGCEWAGQDPK